MITGLIMAASNRRMPLNGSAKQVAEQIAGSAGRWLDGEFKKLLAAPGSSSIGVIGLIRLKDVMMMTNGQSAADRYAARVDAVLAQRTRLRGPQPPGGQRAGCPADNPLVKADPLRPLDPNLAVIASYIKPDDVIIEAATVE